MLFGMIRRDDFKRALLPEALSSEVPTVALSSALCFAEYADASGDEDAEDVDDSELGF
jgi:hypothetical protein